MGAPGTESSGPLYWWSYIYYVSKYYELLDTMLQLTKSGRPPFFFMHTYHHSIVVVMSWLWLEYAMSLQFIAVLFNVFVHTVMYLYFALAARGIRPWWKRHVTTLQIIQFVTSFLCLFPTLYFRLQGEQCQGFISLCFS